MNIGRQYKTSFSLPGYSRWCFRFTEGVVTAIPEPAFLLVSTKNAANTSCQDRFNGPRFTVFPLFMLPFDCLTINCCLLKAYCHSRIQRPRSFWFDQSQKIETSGRFQHRKPATQGLILKSDKSDWLKRTLRMLKNWDWAVFSSQSPRSFGHVVGEGTN